MTAAVCEMCGTTLTMWNRAGGMVSGGRTLCIRCARGDSPEGRKLEIEQFVADHPKITYDEILHYPWSEITGQLINHTLIFLACVWVGAFFGGWLLGMIAGFVGMFLVMRSSSAMVDPLDKKRVQMYDGIMMGFFWLIFWVNYFWVLISAVGGDYRGGNVFFSIWLPPTLIAPALGLLVAWLTDKGRLSKFAEAFRTLKPKTR